MTQVKICGLTTPETVDAALHAGADFLGFVFFERSMRHIAPENAAALMRRVPKPVQTVALFVNPTDDELDHVLSIARPDMIQLHGDEDIKRIAQIKSRFHLPVIRAVKVAERSDLADLAALQSIADWILFDAKTSHIVPGGNGVAFDWTLLKDLRLTKPWMLSGGLNASNVTEALAILSPTAIDVSSGVEESAGIKSIAKITEFIHLV